MHTRILIALYVLFGLTSTSVQGAQSDWRATIHREYRRFSSREGFCVTGGISLHLQTHFPVPAQTAKFLEERRPAELLPYLLELRRDANPVGRDMVDEWIEVASKGLRGVRGTIRCSLGSKTRKIAVRWYAVPEVPDHSHP